MTIQTYYYSYGNTDNLNRRINFINNYNKIQAHIEMLNNENWHLISKLNETEIEVDEMSTLEKAHLLSVMRQSGVKSPEFTTKKLSDFPLNQQVSIIQSLAPLGSRKIEVENGISEIPGIEKVIAITIFKPS